MMSRIFPNNQCASFMASFRNKLALFLLCLSLFFLVLDQAQASSLKGQILLQVEENGEAWYVNPLNEERYYLGRPADAFIVMRSLGLGVSDKDIGSFQLSQAPTRLSGRILLQVQDKGQAFYVSPHDLKLYYLGRPQDAFYLMRSFGLGITNKDLAKIKINNSQAITLDANNSDFKQSFNFKYKNESYSLDLDLSSSLYKHYRNLQKKFSFPSSSDPVLMRNIFYGNFLTIKEGDEVIKTLVARANEIARKKNWNQDESLEFLLALVQYIPYDHEKVLTGANTNPFFPYETLYLNRGVCSDKTFLALAIAREFDYGAAMLDFPDLNHSALGISCPQDDSIRNSGYCFLETTNYFPPGVIPSSIKVGEAEKGGSDFKELFQDSHLGKMEIYQETSGELYEGLKGTKSRLLAINTLNDELKIILASTVSGEKILESKKIEINKLKSQMDEHLIKQEFLQYNALIPSYKSLVDDYNSYHSSYESEIMQYNEKANYYNSLVNSFYQK